MDNDRDLDDERTALREDEKKLQIALQEYDDEWDFASDENDDDEDEEGRFLIDLERDETETAEPLDLLRVNLRFARFDEVLLMVNRVVTVPEFAELTISRPGIRVNDAAGPNKLLDDWNERCGVPPHSVLTI
ncbi:hypothetical protein ElyMa_004954900 [Elysia marginata]|uniref:Uncharacterized protein n=1 Tax=Elysia marginata TaxID=1093978 RepID=A0AAV4J225_9GAST|nr:hypothetical protein ElyMa_004954900 [Elysia marginata]